MLFFVEPDIENADMLVAVDGTTAQAMSAKRPTWTRNDDLARYAWDSTGVAVSHHEAAAVAKRWGGQLPE